MSIFYVESALLVDPKDGIVFANNEATAKTLKKTVDSLICSRLFDLFRAESGRNAKKLGQEFICPKRLLRFKDEHEGRTYDITLFPIHSPTRKIPLIAVYAQGVTAARQTEEVLLENNEKTCVVANALCGIMLRVDRDGIVYQINNAGVSRFRKGREEIIGKDVVTVFPARLAIQLKLLTEAAIRLRKAIHQEDRRAEFYYQYTVAPVFYSDGELKHVTILLRQIGDRKSADLGLQQSNDALEERVSRYTTQPANSNEWMNQEVRRTRRADGEAKNREKELRIKSKKLRELTTALEVLLARRNEEKQKLEANVVVNITQMVEPYLQKLKRSDLDNTQKALLSVMESALANVTSSFLTKLAKSKFNLTPAEIEIAHLVKHGRSSKEIAELMNVSWKTIKSHRTSIRAKLGLRNKKVSLRFHLMTYD